MSTWLITGGSSGLGRALALAVLDRGHQAIVTARDTASLADITHSYPDSAFALPLDLLDRDRPAALVAEAERRFGRIDVLVNNAGHAYRSAIEEGERTEVDGLFATNLFGPIDLIKAVLPGMRMRGAGTIVNISSIAAHSARAASGYYSATKAALGAVSDSLRHEVEPLGITVMLVEPGAFRTDFVGRSLRQPAIAIADYAQTAGLRRKENDTSHGTQPGDPARAARVLVDVIDGGDVPGRLLLGSDAVELVTSEMHDATTAIEAWENTSRSTDFPPGQQRRGGQ